MAGHFVMSSLRPIAGMVAPHAIRELSPLWGSFEEEVAKLDRALKAIQPMIRDAEENQQLGEVSVDIWLSELKSAAYDAEDVLDAINIEFRRRHRRYDVGFVALFHSTVSPIINQFLLLRRVRGVTGSIDLILAEMNKFSFKFASPIARDRCLLADQSRKEAWSSSESEEGIVGRKDMLEEVVRALILESSNSLSEIEEEWRHYNGDKVAVISIAGLGGLGKTTLAQLVYNDERVQDYCHQRIWISTPIDFDLEKIIELMIRSATGEACRGMGMDYLSKRLQVLLSCQRYLLVLDDVWNETWQKWDAWRRRKQGPDDMPQ